MKRTPRKSRSVPLLEGLIPFESETTRYGLIWPAGTTPASIELHCYLEKRTTEQGGLGEAEHLKNAAKMLFPEKMPDGQRGYVWSHWDDLAFEAWCNPKSFPIMAWWGPSSTGKSTRAALLILVDWWAAPDITLSVVCSTTAPMLQRRIFGELVRLFSFHAGIVPGTYLKSQHALFLDKDGDSKNAIYGFAVLAGSAKEAKDNIIGQHNRRMRLVIDEAQSTREAAFEAVDNLSSGADTDFKCIAMGNPDSRLDPLGRYSEPIDGWKSISPDTSTHWTTAFGTCYFFDGRDSPGVRDPERFPFLLGQKNIDETRRLRGADSGYFWQMRIGFIRPESETGTVLTESLIIKHRMSGVTPQWIGQYHLCAGIDPSYAEGGNRCVVSPAMIGEFVEPMGVTGIYFLPEFEIFEKVSAEEPQAYNIMKQIREKLEPMGITPARVALDVTGMQRVLADVFDHEWGMPNGEKVFRVDFAGRPSELPVSDMDASEAVKEYSNRVTELWCNMVAYGRNEQIRGLNLKAVKEFCRRKMIRDKPPMRIESKREMKKRTGGESPDSADSKAVLLAYAREKYGLKIGGGFSSKKRSKALDSFVQDMDIDGLENLYSQSGV